MLCLLLAFCLPIVLPNSITHPKNTFLHARFLKNHPISTMATPPKQGINAVQVSAAKEMFLLSTRSRNRDPNKPVSSVQTALPSTVQSTATTAPFANPNISIPAKSHQGLCHNPQCLHCGGVIIPGPASSMPANDSPSISVGDWEIFTVRRPILNAQEIDDYEARLNLPLPEMIFGKNVVRIRNSRLDWQIEFNAIDALDSVLKIGCDPSLLLKVAHSGSWIQHRQNKPDVKLTDDAVASMVKPYDWTYTPAYKGTEGNRRQFAASEAQIPVKKLKQQDPILFFDDVILYEDELADNGISVLQVKIRVMEKRLLLLCRFFLRIDYVLFRIKDVRIFIEYDLGLVLRDVKQQEDSYENVYNKGLFLASNGDPKMLLRDSNWVSNHLPVVYHEVEQVQLSEPNDSTATSSPSQTATR